jgi:hypothetical protein
VLKLSKHTPCNWDHCEKTTDSNQTVRNEALRYLKLRTEKPEASH